MSKNDTRRIQMGDLWQAVGLLTRLKVVPSFDRGARAAWAFPLAGAIVAIIAGIVGVLVNAVGLPSGLVAATVLLVMITLTGAMHEDGLADCADGFWGGWDQAARLNIMKDSQIGTYGVVALILSLLARWSALVVLIEGNWILAPLIATAALSRAPMVAVMHALPLVRENGLAASVGRPDRKTVVLASAIALLAGLLSVGFWAVPAAIVAMIAAGVFAVVARAKIGGQTGDVLGATQQISEVVILTLLAGWGA